MSDVPEDRTFQGCHCSFYLYMKYAQGVCCSYPRESCWGTVGVKQSVVTYSPSSKCDLPWLLSHHNLRNMMITSDLCQGIKIGTAFIHTEEYLILQEILCLDQYDNLLEGQGWGGIEIYNCLQLFSQRRRVLRRFGASLCFY